MSDNKIILADASNSYNFKRGMPLQYSVDEDGTLRLVQMTRRARIVAVVKEWLRRWTRWFRPRMVVSKVDTAHGRISIGTERWSWRRWRWERQ